MKKLFTIAAVLMLFVGAAIGQVRLDIHSTECVRMQGDPSCTLTQHSYQYFDDPTWIDADGQGEIWTQDCPHTADSSFSCPFKWPAGAAVSGSGVVGGEFHIRSPIDSNGATNFDICWEAKIQCRTITGTGNEVVDFFPGSVGGNWSVQFYGSQIGNSQNSSYIYRGNSDATAGNIDDMAPGASGASCELIVTRETVFTDCTEVAAPIGFEWMSLTFPTP